MAMKEMYFYSLFFLLFLSCFSTYACMLMSFFHVFFWLLNQRSGSQPLRRNSKRPANRQPRLAQSVEQGEDVEVSGMLMTQVHFLVLFGSYNIIFYFFACSCFLFFFLGC